MYGLKGKIASNRGDQFTMDNIKNGYLGILGIKNEGIKNEVKNGHLNHRVMESDTAVVKGVPSSRCDYH